MHLSYKQVSILVVTFQPSLTFFAEARSQPLSVKLGSYSTNVGSLTTTVTSTKQSPKETLAATLENFLQLMMHLSNKQVSFLVVTFQPRLKFFVKARSLPLSVKLGTCLLM